VRRPSIRYLINLIAKNVVAMNSMLPGRAYDAIVRASTGCPTD